MRYASILICSQNVAPKSNIEGPTGAVKWHIPFSLGETRCSFKNDANIKNTNVPKHVEIKKHLHQHVSSSQHLETFTEQVQQLKMYGFKNGPPQYVQRKTFDGYKAIQTSQGMFY